MHHRFKLHLQNFSIKLKWHGTSSIHSCFCWTGNRYAEMPQKQPVYQYTTATVRVNKHRVYITAIAFSTFKIVAESMQTVPCPYRY